MSFTNHGIAYPKITTIYNTTSHSVNSVFVKGPLISIWLQNIVRNIFKCANFYELKSAVVFVIFIFIIIILFEF
jgi:hypothetical protein